MKNTSLGTGALVGALLTAPLLAVMYLGDQLAGDRCGRHRQAGRARDGCRPVLPGGRAGWGSLLRGDESAPDTAGLDGEPGDGRAVWAAADRHQPGRGWSQPAPADQPGLAAGFIPRLGNSLQLGIRPPGVGAAKTGRSPGQ